ncbi:MAG: DUF72 domain-containing protein [Sulfolobales archaeon]|nr:DUF72 domain-containing protein [Sulfolobales archaeon]
MEYFVGTSGWVYSWNPYGSFDWYVKNSGLNSVELNMSFYRFPTTQVIQSWVSKGSSLKWVIKVNRAITHTYKFDGRAFKFWEAFKDLFTPLDRYISFYLFQIPPSITPNLIQRIERFIVNSDLGCRFALEVRNIKWFDRAFIKWASDLGITWVSVDSPNLPKDVYKTNDIVYLRMHGRTTWYYHNYSDDELEEVIGLILKAEPKKVFVFFNNDHDMLENARKMLSKLNNLHR